MGTFEPDAMTVQAGVPEAANGESEVVFTSTRTV